MDYFNPDRPRIGSTPVFLPDGQNRNVLPALSIHPISPERVEVAGFFCKTTTVASRLSIEIALSDLPKFYSNWLADPEKVAFELFGYRLEEDRPKLSRAGPKLALTIDDLGDLNF